MNKEYKLAKEALQHQRLKDAAELLLKLMQNPLAQGLVGYLAVDIASRVRKSNGDPLMADGTVATLKGVAAGFPMASALGGWAGFAAGTSIGAGVGYSELPVEQQSAITGFGGDLLQNILKALVSFP